MMREIEAVLAAARAHRVRTGHPFVTVSYAQSLDGSIAARPGERLLLSSPESLTLTHQLRAAHDAILVGIGTVLADDPLLNVRLVAGPSPRLVVVDSSLRLPIEARLLQCADRRPWIATTDRADRRRRSELEARGARIFDLPSTPTGRVDLRALLETLADAGIDSLMVEGGSEIITSFLAERLANQLIVTVAPLLVGGLPAVARTLEADGTRCFPHACNLTCHRFGPDLVLRADVRWET